MKLKTSITCSLDMLWLSRFGNQFLNSLVMTWELIISPLPNFGQLIISIVLIILSVPVYYGAFGSLGIPLSLTMFIGLTSNRCGGRYLGL